MGIILVKALEISVCQEKDGKCDKQGEFCKFISINDYEEKTRQKDFARDCDKCSQLYSRYRELSKKVKAINDETKHLITKEQLRTLQAAMDNCQNLEKTIKPLLESHPKLRPTLFKDFENSIVFVEDLLPKQISSTSSYILQ